MAYLFKIYEKRDIIAYRIVFDHYIRVFNFFSEGLYNYNMVNNGEMVLS